MNTKMNDSMNRRQTDDKTLIHIRVGSEDVKKLDHLFIDRIGYKSRNEYINAMIAAVLYQDASSPERADKPVPACFDAWCNATIPQVPEAAIQKSLSAALWEMAYPKIAIDGATQAYESVGQEVISQVHDETGFWLSNGVVNKAFADFELLHTGGLYNFRQLVREGKTEEAQALWMTHRARWDSVNN